MVFVTLSVRSGAVPIWVTPVATRPWHARRVPVGRFAPSPTGELHLGNLRTALVAWLAARSTSSRFLVRFEDLDQGAVREHFYDAQLAALAAIGLDWDEAPLRQSSDRPRYDAAVRRLTEGVETFPCFCTRREIAESAQAPHGPGGPLYPGTCHELTPTEQAERRAAGRRPAIRLRARRAVAEIVDVLAGPVAGVVDDIVLVRNDGTPAYNLAVVVDDAAQGVEQVVRADDLLASSPTQAHLARQLGLPVPEYLHVPLVLGPDGSRLAKRDGAVTLTDLAPRGVTPDEVCGVLAHSLGLTPDRRPVAASDLVAAFSADGLPREPWIIDPASLFAG